MNVASPPCWRMIPTVPSPPAVSRSTTTTFAPLRANPRAVARPMPLPAPVISATLPLKSMVSSGGFCGARLSQPIVSVEKLAPRLLETGPDIRGEGSRHVDAKLLRAGAPKQNFSLAEHRPGAHADRECREVQIECAESVDDPGRARAGYAQRRIAMRDIDGG